MTKIHVPPLSVRRVAPQHVVILMLENAEFVISSIIGKRGKSQEVGDEDTGAAAAAPAEGEAKEEAKSE